LNSADSALADAVDSVLSGASEPLKFEEIREFLKLRGLEPAESTLYAHLGRGKSSGRYLNRSNRWEMAR